VRRLVLPERPDWRAQAEALGFHFHTIDGERYWDERTPYAFSLREVEDDIEAPTRELHDMAMQLVDEAVRSEALLDRLAIPPVCRDWIRDSWTAGAPHLYGRMDLAYDGTGPAKLYELNYDTPTALYEAAYFQWLWLEQQIDAGHLPRGADQYNRIQELLCEAFGHLARDRRIARPVHFAAVRGSEEDQATVAYLRDCAHQVGVETQALAIEDIGLDDAGRFTDLQDRVIRTLVKLYPLEFMMQEQFGAALRAGTLQLVEPPWKAILSNKAILPLLWERHAGHPNLLPAHFEDDVHRLRPGWVRKPLFSREGANIDALTPDGTALRSPGPYGDGPTILQAWHPLPAFEGRYPVIGSWVIADEPAGMGLREDASPITRDTSCFVPHVILD
jgi:glutathionylspermidine synthase